MASASGPIRFYFFVEKKKTKKKNNNNNCNIPKIYDTNKIIIITIKEETPSSNVVV
jgi:hypothetical protein